MGINSIPNSPVIFHHTPTAYPSPKVGLKTQRTFSKIKEERGLKPRNLFSDVTPSNISISPTVLFTPIKNNSQRKHLDPSKQEWIARNLLPRRLFNDPASSSTSPSVLSTPIKDTGQKRKYSHMTHQDQPPQPLKPRRLDFSPVNDPSPVNSPNTNSINRENLKRKFATFLEASKGPKKKKARKILPIAQTASLVIDRKKVEITPEMVREHAFTRMQHFASECIARWGIAVSSTGDSGEDLNVLIRGARLQGSQGSYGRHAAHSNAAAGVVDNELENLYARTVIDGVTPMKKQVLRVLGLSLEDVKELRKNHKDEDLVLTIFKKIVEINKERKFSILAGTELEQQTNATTELPKLLNLVCDGGLEKALRPSIARLYQKVMLAKLTPEEACLKYCDLIQTHFTRTIQALDERIKLIKDYWKLTKKINSSVHTSQLLEMNKIKKLLEVSKPGVPKAELKMNYKYVNAVKKGAVPKQGNRRITTKWIKSIRNQKIAKYELLRDWCIWENEGTRMPNLDLLAKEFNEGSRLNLLRNANAAPIEFSPETLEYRSKRLAQARKEKISKQLF